MANDIRLPCSIASIKRKRPVTLWYCPSVALQAFCFHELDRQLAVGEVSVDL